MSKWTYVAVNLVLVGAIVALLMCAGCASGGKVPAVDEMYKAYLSQPRTYQPVRMVAAPGRTITISGLQELTLDSQLTPLSMRSADPSTAQAAIAAIERVMGIGLGAWAIKEVATHDPPAPTVVQPEVVMVPAE